MAITQKISGINIDLSSVTIEDGEFTLEIRKDETLTEFIPKVNSSIEQQVSWIEKQRKKEGDYFFLISNKSGKKLGTAAIYDIKKEDDICEFGRYISYGNVYENVETAILCLEFIFHSLQITTVMLNNDVRNKKIISFWKRFGARLDGEYEYEGWTAARYLLTKQQYESSSTKIKALLGERT